MKFTSSFLAIFCVIAASTFGQAKAGMKLPERVIDLLQVQSSAPLGSDAFDDDLLLRLRSLGSRKDVVHYLFTRAEQQDLIARAEWQNRIFQIWFGAYEDGARVECDIEIAFSATDEVRAVQSTVTREPSAPKSESVRTTIQRLRPPAKQQ